jgi:hypothetical protein
MTGLYVNCVFDYSIVCVLVYLDRVGTFCLCVVYVDGDV